jgi:hypothetical protein
MQTLLEIIFSSFKTWHVEKHAHKNSSPNIFSFKRYKIGKIRCKRTKIQHYTLFCPFPSLHNDFVNVVSFKQKYVWT